MILTTREREILYLLCSGCTISRIASVKNLSTRSIYNHLHNLRAKFNVPNNIALVLLLKAEILQKQLL